jgi:hypothetical protein
MKTTSLPSLPSSRLVPALAATAVAIAALAAATSAWIVRSGAAAPRPQAQLQSQRPAPDGPVNVVRAPATATERSL